LSSECNWYRDQYDALDALVKALRTDNRWLEYQVEAMRDELLDQDARAAEDASAVAKVRTTLLEWDEALQKAREDLAGMLTVAAEWESEVATTRAQLQQDRATLEGARAWQSQAEEKAKEVEQLKTSLVDKAASLASTEEQLQRERTSLAEARATLERERLAREGAQGRLQQERAALEGAQATLKQRDEEVSRLDGELTQVHVFLGESSAGKVSLAQVACRKSGKGEGSYPAGGVGYPRLALLRPLATRVPRRFTQ
jgi:chromosome segregation ATPase